MRVEDIEDGKLHHKIADITELEGGPGAEYLKGSGPIAGETSCDYADMVKTAPFTACSIGTGTYLVRLEERAVQVEGHLIIFMGAPALKGVPGQKVYTSNLQLGNTRVIHENGVSHLVQKPCKKSLCKETQNKDFRLG